MLKSLSCVKRRVNVDALYLSSVFLFEGFEGEEVVAVDENILVGGGRFKRISVLSSRGQNTDSLGGVFNQNARLQFGVVAFANPGQFEFGMFFCHGALVLRFGVAP